MVLGLGLVLSPLRKFSFFFFYFFFAFVLCTDNFLFKNFQLVVCSVGDCHWLMTLYFFVLVWLKSEINEKQINENKKGKNLFVILSSLLDLEMAVS